MTTATLHKFEAAGLGAAPYKSVGVEVKHYQAYPGAPLQVGGSCDYCATGIVNMFWLESADGKTFKVGSDCIKKAGDKGLMKVVAEAERKARAVKADAKRQKDLETRRAVAAELTAILADPTVGTSEPHPSIAGKTYRDYVEFCQKFAGLDLLKKMAAKLAA